MKSGAAAEVEGQKMDQEASEREAWGLFRMDERLWVIAVEGEKKEEGESKSVLDLAEDELAVRMGGLPDWESGASISSSFSVNGDHRSHGATNPNPGG